MVWASGAVVTAAQLNANAPQEWTAYTPTIAGWTLGNGTIVGRYCRHGDTVILQTRLLMGSTSAAAGVPVFNLPIPALSNVTNGGIGAAWWFDASTTIGYVGATRVTPSGVSVYMIGTNGALGGSHPFVVTTSDYIEAHVVYEAA